MKKKMSLKVKLVFLQISSFIISVAPLIIIFAINWGEYTKTPTDTIKLCLGGTMLLVLVFIKVVGKLHIPHRIVFFSIVFILSYLLQVVLQDIILLSGMALLGEFCDCVLFQRAIKVTRENILINKTADVTTQKMEEVIKGTSQACA